MKWVSIKDELPPSGIEVLCWYNKKLKHKRSIAIGVYYIDKWLSINGSSWPDKPDPTHWVHVESPQ